jgi:hypothetical protein
MASVAYGMAAKWHEIISENQQSISAYENAISIGQRRNSTHRKMSRGA